MCQQVFFLFLFLVENPHKANTDCTSKRPTSHVVKCFENKGKVFI